MHKVGQLFYFSLFFIFWEQSFAPRTAYDDEPIFHAKAESPCGYTIEPFHLSTEAMSMSFFLYDVSLWHKLMLEDRLTPFALSLLPLEILEFRSVPSKNFISICEY